MDPTESCIEWCEEATERGGMCTVVKTTTKASRHNRLFDCPTCRNKLSQKSGKNDEGTGGGSTGSSTAGIIVKVGA